MCALYVMRDVCIHRYMHLQRSLHCWCEGQLQPLGSGEAQLLCCTACLVCWRVPVPYMSKTLDTCKQVHIMHVAVLALGLDPHTIAALVLIALGHHSIAWWLHS